MTDKNKEDEFSVLMMETINAALEKKVMDVATMLNKAKHGKGFFSICEIDSLRDAVSYAKESRFSDYDGYYNKYIGGQYRAVYRTLHCSDIYTISDDIYAALVDSVISYAGLNECCEHDVFGGKKNEIIDKYKATAHQVLIKNKDSSQSLRAEMDEFLSSHEGFVSDAELDEILSGHECFVDDTKDPEQISYGIKYLNKKPNYFKLIGFCLAPVVLILIYFLNN